MIKPEVTAIIRAQKHRIILLADDMLIGNLFFETFSVQGSLLFTYVGDIITSIHSIDKIEFSNPAEESLPELETHTTMEEVNNCLKSSMLK